MKLGELAARLGCKLDGDENGEVHGVAGIEKARAGELLKRGFEPILNAAVEAEFPHAMSHFTKLSKHPAFAPDVEPYLAKLEKVASR